MRQEKQQNNANLTSFKALCDEVFPASLHECQVDERQVQLLKAVLTNAFRHSTQEAIYGKDDYIAHESLARPFGEDGQKFHIAEIAAACYDRGLHEVFDYLTCCVALENATDYPVTLNVSVTSIVSPEFCAKVEKKVKDHGLTPDDIVFEILEHDVDPNVNTSHLREMKEKGFRFALDDFAKGQRDTDRLLAFGELVDYIKIDGPLVRAGLGDAHNDDGSKLKFKEADFHNVLGKINDYYCKHGSLVAPPLIAERVRTKDEVKRLFDMGFAGVQGRDLGKIAADIFHYVKRQNTPSDEASLGKDDAHAYTELSF